MAGRWSFGKGKHRQRNLLSATCGLELSAEEICLAIGIAGRRALRRKIPNTNWQEKARHNLLKYCELDTFAMVKVWQALVQASC